MKKVLLCIMDGVGYRKQEHGNAVLKANTKCLDKLIDLYPHSLLEASGKAVGLPANQMGNSEVGHMNIGAGRVVYQSIEIINNEIESKRIYDNENINKVINHVIDNNSKLHLLGLLSDGGVHSHINHLFALLDICKNKGIKDVYVHVFTDGRDTLSNSAIKYLNMLMDKMKNDNYGKIASISGRYYAMDRDNNYDRVRKCYDVIVNGLGKRCDDIIKYIENNYNNNITDEFIKPILVDSNGIINHNDGLLVFNYRPDRLRELFSAISNDKFSAFPRKKLKNIKLVTMMGVSDEVICDNAYNIENINNTLGEYISSLGLKQLRIAETEKYAHVTYFFDGGQEKEIPLCDKILIPSSKVATYDLKPEMSAYEITNRLLEIIDNYDLTVLNFANGDMVGHTGVFDATVRAVEVVDECIGKIYDKCINNDIIMVITADHGNSDYMLDDKDNIVTSHSTSPVRFIVTMKGCKLVDGKLSDIAASILDIMQIEKPVEMTGKSLIER